MASYIVTYDLNRETVRPKIVDKIKDISAGWAMLSESSYAITSPETPADIYTKLSPLLDSDDALYVIHLSRPFHGQGPDDVNKWLEDHLD